MNFTHADKNGCGKSYLLDLPVCAILECSCLQPRSSGEISELPSIQNYPDLPYIAEYATRIEECGNSMAYDIVT